MINQAQKTPQERRRGGGFDTGELVIPSVRDVLRIAFRHKGLIAMIFVLAGLAGAGVSLVLPEVWESEGRILLTEERGALRINPASEGMVTASQFDMAGADSELAILTSQGLAEEIASKVGLERVLSLKEGETINELFKDEGDPQAAAIRIATKKLLQNAIIEPQGGVLWFVYRHDDPVIARDILHTWMHSYIDRHIEVHSSSAKPELFQQKLDDRKAHLDRLEAELNTYMAAHGVAAVTQEIETTGTQVFELETRLADTRTEIEAEKARIATLKQALKGREGDIEIRPMEMENPDRTALDEQLRVLGIRETELESRYVNHPDLRAVRIEIAETKAKRDALPRTVPRTVGGAGDVEALDPALQLNAAQVNLSGLEATEATLMGQLEPAREHLSKLRQAEPAVVMLEREVAAARDQYEATRTSLLQAQQSEALDANKVSNVRIVDEATLPDERTSPRRKRLTVMAAFAGLVIGLGLAFVREFFDATIKSRDEAEKKLGITVLAVVPEREFKKCI